MVIRAHVVKVYNNYASTLIIYKATINFHFYLLFPIKKYGTIHQMNSFALMKNSKAIHYV